MIEKYVLLAHSKEPTVIDAEIETDWQTSGKYLSLSGNSLDPRENEKRKGTSGKAPRSDGESGPLDGMTEEEREHQEMLIQLRKDYELKLGKSVPSNMKNDIEWMVKKINEGSQFDPTNPENLNDGTQN